MKIPFTAIDRWYQEIKDELFDYYHQVYKSANPFDHPVKQNCVEILKKITGRKHIILCQSGSDALSVMLYAVQNITDNHHITTTNMSYVAPAQAAITQKFKLDFLDIDQTGQTNSNDLEINVASESKIFLNVNNYGECSNLKKIKDFCDSHNKIFLVDAAQSLLCKYDNIDTSKFGLASTLSFGHGKPVPIFGTMGAILTDDDSLADFLKLAIKNGHMPTKPDGTDGEVVTIGKNSMPQTDKCAQLLCSLKNIDKWHKRRKSIINYYNNNLKRKDIIKSILPGCDPNGHKYVLLIKKNREQFCNFLQDNGIGFRKHYGFNFGKTKIFGEIKKSYPVTDFFNNSVVTIPIHAWLSDVEVETIVKKINSYEQF